MRVAHIMRQKELVFGTAKVEKMVFSKIPNENK